MNKYRILVAITLLTGVSLLAQPTSAQPGLHRPPEKIKIALTVDGSDNIYIQGTDLWIVHETFEYPSDIRIDGRKWECQWNNNTSDHYTKLDPPFAPRPDGTVEVRKSKGRDGVILVQKPTAENNFTTVVRIADTANGSDRYEFLLTWEK